MFILAIECSAGPVSAAVTEDGALRAGAFSNVKVTHSETLMPLIDNLLGSARIGIGDIDCFAVANGPGSFTGVRIGIAAVKGMAAAKDTPCCGVSTLLSMAYRFTTESAVVCPVMDARRSQLYNALFLVDGGAVTRICADRAISCEELAAQLAATDKKIIVCGDGAAVFAPFVKDNGRVVFAAGELALQNAAGVAAAAYEEAKRGNTVSPAELLPVYLRLPQAERELKLKQEKDLIV